MRSFFRAGCISQDFWFCQQQKWPCLDLQQGTVCHCRCKLLLHCGCWYRNRGRAPSTLAERAHHQTAFASKECSGNRGPRGCVNAGKRLGNAAAASSQSRRSPCTHTHMHSQGAATDVSAFHIRLHDVSSCRMHAYA